MRPKKLVGIAGASCSGKTTLVANLANMFGDKMIQFPFDELFVGLPALEGQTVTTWEDPAHYRWADLAQHLRDLKAGHSTRVGATSRERRAAGVSHVVVEPREIVVIAGFLALHDPEVRELYDLTIFMDLPEAQIVDRRLARRPDPDNPDPWDKEGYIRGELIEGHRRVVLPQRALAHYIVSGTLPPQTVACTIRKLIAG